MTEYNVYEQRPPIRSGKDGQGNVNWMANLVFLGGVRGPDAINKAKEKFKVRHPVLHELDFRGEERHY